MYMYNVTSKLYLLFIALQYARVHVYELSLVFIVLSVTVWMGHLNKGLNQEQLSEKISQYGKVKTIDVSFLLL